MENQTYHIQKLLADKLDNYKGKESNEHIKEIQDTYKQKNIIMKEKDVKGKQWIQDEEV